MARDVTCLSAESAPIRIWDQMIRLAVESQIVIGMRMAGMMGMVPQSPGEPFRMIGEKQAAISESFYALAKSSSEGASVEHVISAALIPYSTRTYANTRRLTRSG